MKTPALVAAFISAAFAVGPAFADSPPDGVPALVWAAYNADAAGVRAQLDFGASPDAAVSRAGALPSPCQDPNVHWDDNAQTALLWAAAKGDVDLVKTLLAKGAAWDKRDGQGWAPLHAAACNGRAETVAALLAAAPDRKAAAGLRSGHEEARFETHNVHGVHFGKTPLHAAALGDPARFDDLAQTANVLLQAGADPNAADDGGETPLHDAALKCDARFAALLLDGSRPASPDIRDQSRRLPSDLAKIAPGCDVAALNAALHPSVQSLAASLKKGLDPKLLAGTRDWRTLDPGSVGAGPSASATGGAARPGAGGAGAVAPAGERTDLALPAPPQPGAAVGSVAGIDIRALQSLAADPALPADKRVDAVRLLSQRRDPALVPFFTTLLKDPVTCAVAAAALSAVLENLKAKQQGADWSGFTALAADVIGPLGRMPETSPANGLYRALLSNITLMPDAAQDDFVKRFSDVDLLLMLGYNTAQQRIDENNGLHSDAAKKIYAALQDRLKQNGRSLSSLLDSPEVTALPQTRVRVLTQLYKYDLMGQAEASDPSLASSMPARLFPSAYKSGSMGTFEAYSVGDQIMSAQADAARFAKTLLQGVRAGTVDPAKGLLFLKFHEKQLAAQEASDLQALWTQSKYVPDWVRAHYDDREKAAVGQPPVYQTWPAGKLNVLLVMTQAEKADEFIKALGGKGAGADVDGMRRTSVDTRTKSGKPVHIDFEIFESDKQGWALKEKRPGETEDAHAGVTKALIAGLDSPSYQAVFYRGHVGDYEADQVRSQAKPQNKVFGDLGCYSDIESEKSISSCKTCAYFGTTVVSQAERTNGFLPLLLDALAQRMSYDAMYQQFKKSLPATHEKFTGSYDPADRFASDLVR